MFARESDAVSPRLGDINLVSSERTLNSLYVLYRDSQYVISYFENDKVSLRVCNLSACRKVAWRNNSRSYQSVRRSVDSKIGSRHYEVIKFSGKNISIIIRVKTKLRTKGKVTTLKVVAAIAIVTAATAVAQGVRTR